MTRDAFLQAGTPDSLLELRLDALRKNFQQIARTRKEVEARVDQVKHLEEIARNRQLGVDHRLESIGDDIAATKQRLETLAKRVPLEGLKNAIDELQRVTGQMETIGQDVHEILQIVEEMSEGWSNTAGDRLKMLDTTLLHESDMKATIVEGFEQDLKDSTESRATIWDEYEELAYRGGEALFGEYVDFMGGLALRNTGLDCGVCRMADDLIGRLYRIGGDEILHSMTLPTRRVASRKTIARIIRMGFPEWTVWAVPLGVHEFGHVVIPEIRELQGLIEAAEADLRWTFGSPQRDHYLADAFATCTMGPAYACATVLLSLDPCCEDRAERERPGEHTCPSASPDSRRAYVILKTLELMAEPTADYEGVRSMLFDAWTSALGAFDMTFDLGDEATELDACAEVMWEFLNKWSSHIMYKAGRYAESARWPSLRALVGDDGDDDPSGGATVNPVLAELGGRDVLNMAWRERLSKPENATGEEADRIAAAALELWRKLFHEPPPLDTTWHQPIRGGPR